MHVQRRDVAAMTTQQSMESPEPYSLPPTAFYTLSRASRVIPVYSNAHLTTPVHVHRHYVSSPGASYPRSVREYIAPPSPTILSKPRHRHIPLPSQIESDIPTVVHPLLRPSRGEMVMELDFAHSLTSVRVLGYEGCVNEAATNPPLPSLAIIHQKLPWPIVIRRSGDREWVTVADVVETIWYALHIRDTLQTSTSSPFLESHDDAPFDGRRSMRGCDQREVVQRPRLMYLRGKTQFIGLRAIGGDTWELLVA
ncbi:uncharacterized protein BT62DRAFT_925906 [Guyanagaster necrorhizus]|uniref:DUF6699 domain-containing protein n=1 Tax=Guyanagaster necrorhizus TaxID=856835 RepID=A0A9P7W4B8_9AGAR|nr:uncharacterized protein BT62DRAFT_925906 [Guyanagaster necrorhizus MCA 3950]KAG7451725.1 hypothetical protein BT62DRAFT_925906 [Guyanagaster necrorhizus MCA 3950]